eukprot:5432_1
MVMGLQLFVIALISTKYAHGYNNGVGLKPALGWNTWCTVGFCGSDRCSEFEVKSAAQALKSNGMYELGYTHINLDDCWEHCGGRSENGSIRADPIRFPSGIENLATFLHEEGFKFGLYTSAGTKVCSRGLHCVEKAHGSYGHYEQDANTFAAWQVDYVKVDWCGENYNNSKTEHTEFSNALNATGRHMWLELCRGYSHHPIPTYVAQVANSWRVTGDHKDKWDNTIDAIEAMAGNTNMSAPYNWAYNDFLMTGGEGCIFDVNPDIPSHHCPGMSHEEYMAEFAIWAITASPLLVATDVRNMTKTMKYILLNEEIIAVNQNYKQSAGDRINNATINCDKKVNNACQVWSRKMNDTSIAVVLLNEGQHNYNITVRFDMLNMKWDNNSNVNVRDLWQHNDIGQFVGSFTDNIHYHSAGFYMITQVS